MTAFDINSFNLIPARVIYHRRKTRMLRIWAVVCSIVLIVALVPAVIVMVGATAQQTHTPEHIASYQRTIESLQTNIALLKKKKALLQYNTRVSTQLDSRIPWNTLLSLLVHTSQDTIRFTSINASGDSTNTSIPISIQISGYAKNQSNIRKYIVHLESTGLFDSVTLLKTQRTTIHDISVVSFQASADIHPSSSSASDEVTHEK